jgi:hypothetical protein
MKDPRGTIKFGDRVAKMFKIYSIIAAAALVAGALVMAPSLNQVSATTRGAVAHTQTTSGKGDRLDLEARLACRQQSWPYLDRSCVRDMRTESGTARKVRTVSADRK